jgi:3-oxoacyl-[acyl-carrier-protein] synthase III
MEMANSSVHRNDSRTADDAARPRGEVGIVDAAYYLPGPPVDIVEWAAAQGVPPSLVEKLLANGCRYFHEMTDQKPDADLIATAVERLAQQRAAELRQVSILVHTHTQAFSMPAPPSSILSDIVRRFDLRPELCFSCGHTGCASGVAAVDWARRLLEADENAKYALVVTSDRVFGGAEYRIRQEAGIHSDSASALLLGKNDLRCVLGPATYKNYPKLHEGAVTPENSATVARTAWLHLRTLLQEHARRSGIDLSDSVSIMPGNSDGHYWVQIARAMDLPEGTVFLDNIRERGHGHSANFAINLVDHGFGLLQAGEVVVACGHSNLGAYSALTLLPSKSNDSRRAKTPAVGEAVPCV